MLGGRVGGGRGHVGTHHLSKQVCGLTVRGQIWAPMLTALISLGDLSSDLGFGGQRMACSSFSALPSPV